jgi:DNA repair exonuclease SbcCD ATPase subunit
MTMDLGQLTQMATWLDEEHRRDKAELIKLQQQLDRQESEQVDQTRILKDLEGRMANVQAQLLKFTQLQTALQQLKEEVVQMLAQADERRLQETREAERVRAIERDNVSRALNELRKDLQRLPRMNEEIELRKAEQRRVGESLLGIQQAVSTLSQETENRLRTLSFLEDGRQQDTKRIARLQQESVEALKRLEQHDSRLQMIEAMTQRQERDSTELKELIAQMRSAQRDFVDGQLLQTEHMKRQMAEWAESLEVYANKMDSFSARMQEFSEAFREDRHVVERVERFQEQIKREQTQVAELQRLAEERQKRQLEQWQEENEKRWRKELLRWDHQVSEQSQRNKQVGDHFIEVEARLAQHRAEIDWAWKYLQSQLAYQVQEARRWQGEMTKILEEKPKKE